MKVQYRKLKGGWQFRAVARNGKVVCSGWGYNSLQGARKGVKASIKILTEGLQEVI